MEETRPETFTNIAEGNWLLGMRVAHNSTPGPGVGGGVEEETGFRVRLRESSKITGVFSAVH